jgi:Spx/MgsR family transcriptional regulator
MAKSVTIYGIKNCDTMKKARAWLDKRGVAYEFHDYKTAGIERGQLERWSSDVGWETLLNRAGMTFRKLAERDKEGLTEKKAIALMAAQPAKKEMPTGSVLPQVSGRRSRLRSEGNHRLRKIRLK